MKEQDAQNYEGELTFWDHLEVLRWALVRIAGVEHIIVEAEAFESADMMEGVGKCADYLLKADFVKADYTK